MRMTGTLLPQETGRHTFSFSNTSFCRLFLDDQLVLENQAPPAGPTSALVKPAVYTCDLTAGAEVKLRIEFLKDNDESFAYVRLNLGSAYQPGEDNRIARAAELAANADVALVFAGMPEGYESEGSDRPDMALPGPQVELIRAVVKANPRTVVILNAGSPVEMPWIGEIPAVLEAFYPGQEGGNAVARILLGEVNPSGKLSETFPQRLEDTPAFVNYPGTRDVNYGEGIFVGYRYYEKKKVTPLFPFGHGLSYTSFAYSNISLPTEARAGDEVTVRFMVKNEGAVAGKEIVQVYVRDEESSLARPLKELKGFTKVSLNPGETANVEVSLDQRAFAYYDPYRSEWVVEPGKFEILVGASSADIRLTGSITLS
jgi:beta-glucosidase